MQVLNATKSVKSILADDGELIQILPGQVSKVFTASSHTIRAAINLGDPSEIGIILGGSWERDIAKTITASADYLYTDLNEAKGKLIDPSIDYSESARADISSMKDTAKEQQYKEKINILTAELDLAKSEIASLKNNTELSNLQDKLTDQINLNKELEKERDNIKSQLTESQDQVSDLSKDYQKLKSQMNDNQNIMMEAQKKVDELSAKIAEYESNASNIEVDTSKMKELQQNVDDLYAENQDFKSKLSKKDEEIDKLVKQVEDLNIQLGEASESAVNSEELEKLREENSKLKENLKEATDKIDSMVTEFNTACDKFKITKNEQGEWIQDLES